MIIFEFLCYIILFLYTLYELIKSVRNLKYQKIWNQKRLMLVRIDPAITRAELCEQYVMFCAQNHCKVEY